MSENDASTEARPDGPGNLEDVAAAHAAGRPPSPPTGDPKKDARRERERARYAEKRGLPKKTPVGAVSAAPSAESFTPETCKALVGLPFDVAGVALQSKAFALDKDETEMLAGPCAATLNAWCPDVDPRWSATSAFALALLTVASKKYITWQEERRLRRETPEDTNV